MIVIIRGLLTCVMLLVSAVCTFSSDLDDRLASIIERAEQNCGSSFILEDKAVTYIELTSDSINSVIVVDEDGFQCPYTGPSTYCGSGGCKVHLLTEVEQLSGFARGWEIIQTQQGKKVILLSLHGSACEEVGTVGCFKVISVFEGRLVYQD